MINKKSVVHCFFEQSGTFKNEFKKLGYHALDYDLKNDFKETDYICDLFYEIDCAYRFKDSVFDKITEIDLIFAFFPCYRFEKQILLNFRGDNYSQKNKSSKELIFNDMVLMGQLNFLYEMLCKLVLVCYQKKLKLIIENPYDSQHFLIRYWSLKPKIIDYNRRLRGDFYKKPTMYYFINCDPLDNFIFEAVDLPSKKVIVKENKVVRSLMSKQYANRFIREFIINE